MALNEGFAYREQIGPGAAGRTVLAHLAAAWPHSTEAVWRERIEHGEVLLEGRTARPGDLLTKGQWLVWNRPPWDEPDAPLDFAVLYRDADLLAVAKPSGLPTVPGGGYLEHTLLARVRRLHPEASPLHRLGRGTSGLVLFARTQEAGAAVQGAWRRRVRKIYRALAAGEVEADAFEVDAPIGPVPHALLGRVHAASPQGKPSHSRVQVVERRADATLVDVEIETGRAHQIRIHLAAAGHPLVGDPLYPAGGVPDPSTGALPGDPGYLLHAMRLVLPHPRTGQTLDLWCAPPPLLRAR